MALVRLRRAAQITLAHDIREVAHLKEWDYLVAEVTESGTILLKPVNIARREPTPEQAAEILSVVDHERKGLCRRAPSLTPRFSSVLSCSARAFPAGDALVVAASPPADSIRPRRGGGAQLVRRPRPHGQRLHRPHPRDPDDEHVIALAVAVGAEVIVTGDKDLLTLGEFQAVRIITTRAFLSWVTSPSPPCRRSGRCAAASIPARPGGVGNNRRAAAVR